MNLTRSNEERRKGRSAFQPLAGEVAIVTGASSGIGAVTAKELARRGAIVALAARRVDRLEAEASEINGAGCRAVAIPTDVTDSAQVMALVERTVELFGRIDILVNNAGILSPERFIANSTEQIRQVVNVNLLGAILMTRAVLPGMLERHHGAIISVSSVSAHIAAVDPLYCATKFGLRGFSLSLYRDLANTGVSASLVSPGFVRTPFTSFMRLRMPDPGIVAKTIADLVVHPRREIVVPGYYRPLIRGERMFPWLADRVIRWLRRHVMPTK